MRRLTPVVALVALLSLTPFVGSSARASSGNESVVSIISQRDTLVFMSSADATFMVNQNWGGQENVLMMDVEAPGGRSEQVTLAAPNDAVLTPGDYLHARIDPPAGQPTLEICTDDGEGAWCGAHGGRFRVHEISWGVDGQLASLWVDFEQDCIENHCARGELRYNEPGDGGSAVVGIDDVWWPDAQTDASGLSTPVTVENPGPDAVQMDASSITGSDAADDSIVSDGCAGQVLESGDTCQVVVGYEPLAAGTNSATLNIPEDGGFVHTVSLDGTVAAGETDFSLQSDPDDFIGDGGTYDYVPATSWFLVTGNYNKVTLGFGDSWEATFGAPTGQQLTPGVTYTGATRSGGHAAPTLDITHASHGCNVVAGNFTVTDIYVDPWGDVERFGVRFEQHCEGATPALRGTFKYQLNEVTATTTADGIQVAGAVSPNEPGRLVQLALKMKSGGAYVPVLTTRMRINGHSGYRARFAPPASGTLCRIVASFLAPQKHLSHRTVRTFRCSTP